MVQRSVCLYNGKIVGIETIYTVINGQQIKIRGKVEALRAKSRNDELFCPCGCGANLILVAGDRGLREQHFRIKYGDEKPECRYVSEGRASVNAKIVLQCWVEDNLHDEDLESRVPICAVGDSNRKYEFTFLSRARKIAVSYCYDSSNLSDEKLNILKENSAGIQVIHITDCRNLSTNDQYPENVIKIQDRQKYCLFLNAENEDYYKAQMTAAFYAQDADGLWLVIPIVEGPLNQYRINPEGKIFFKDRSLSDLYQAEKIAYDAALQQQQKRIQEQIEREEKAKAEQQKILEQREAEAKAAAAEWKRRQDEIAREAEAEAAQKWQEEQKKKAEYAKIIAAQNIPHDKQYFDMQGNRLLQCKFCGRIATDGDFYTYGVDGKMNLGICNDCDRNNPEVAKMRAEQDKVLELGKQQKQERPHDRTICPECGKKLLERHGKYGPFISCSGYPECHYHRNKW